MRIGYTIELGSITLSEQPDEGGPPLLALDVGRSMGGTGGRARIELGNVGAAMPAVGDRVRIELDAGEGSSVVFTGEVEEVARGTRTVVVQARDALARLAEHEVESGYEEASAGFIVKDLVEAAGAEAGTIEEGPTFPRYVVHGGGRALQHAQRLAALLGADLYSDAEGKVCCERPAKGSPAHRLRWGEHLLQVSLEREPLRTDSLAVWGEGAAGTDGSDKEHWLTTDLSGVAGKAEVSESNGQRTVTPKQLGKRPRTLIDGAIRSVDAADEIAEAYVKRLELRPVRGSVLVLGLPEAALGQWVELAELPESSNPVGRGAAVQLRVRGVRHRLSPSTGLVTELRF